MAKNQFILLLVFIASITLSACEKEEGEGGRALITGRVLVQEFSDAGNLTAEYYAADEQVYIIYGDGSTHDDNMRSSFDGSYRFEYLRKGTYTIFVYSECPSCPSGDEAIQAEVTISSNKAVVEVPDIVIADY